MSNENVDVPDVKNGNWKLVSFSALTRQIIQRELKQRHSDSLCETEAFQQASHRTSGCYS